VEFAILLPVLVLLLFGMMEFGRLWFLQSTMAGAAREGAREFAINKVASSARDVALAAAPGLGLSAGDISVTPSGCASGSVSTVVITHSFSLLTGILAGPITLTGQASMRCNG
jgi:Flp pilus assembly protein TadG